MSDEYEIFESDIAIVGMAARVPGARNPGEFWSNLAGGVESIRFFSDEELLAAGVSPEDFTQKSYVPASAPLDDMEQFDGEFFGFSPKESAIMDPQHRHFLECAWEALESAGHPPERFEGPIGVFAGCGMGSYFYFHLCTHPELVRDVGMFLLRHTGNDKDFLATRTSYLLDLHGPAVGVQTACSTSLVAVHLGVQSLLARECDMALCGGVTVLLPHRQGYHYEEGEILSPDGHCHAFDHRAQGTVFGSGAGVVALRRLEDALDDGDVIHAVIRGSAVNNDGSRKVNYLAPSVDGQAACMVEAFGIGQVDPRTIGYVECHGTGTYLGDPIEIEALTQAFRTATQDRGFCRIGSVKTNIGHLDTAAGVASLIKASLALEHATFPPSLGYEKPNPTIDFASSPFVVNDACTLAGAEHAPAPRRRQLARRRRDERASCCRSPRASRRATSRPRASRSWMVSAKSGTASTERVAPRGVAPRAPGRQPRRRLVDAAPRPPRVRAPAGGRGGHARGSGAAAGAGRSASRLQPHRAREGLDGLPPPGRRRAVPADGRRSPRARAGLP
ncbi:MAG: polyketide synthase [Sandaracinaceae bacterium]